MPTLGFVFVCFHDFRECKISVGVRNNHKQKPRHTCHCLAGLCSLPGYSVNPGTALGACPQSGLRVFLENEAQGTGSRGGGQEQGWGGHQVTPHLHSPANLFGPASPVTC